MVRCRSVNNLESKDVGNELPALPEPSDLDGARWGYTADDMRNHAIDAYRAGLSAGRQKLLDYLHGMTPQQAADVRKDAERYRMLRDNGYLDYLCGGLHPCDEPRRLELTDAQVDCYAAMLARRLLVLPNVADKRPVLGSA